MRRVSEPTNRVRLMGHRIPSWQSGTDWISTILPMHAESTSSDDEILEDSCSILASAQHRLLLHAKGSGSQRHFQSSTPSPQGAFSWKSSYQFSDFMIHTVLFAVGKPQRPSWGSFELFSQTPPISQRRQHQVDRRFAKLSAHPGFEVRDIFLRSKALAENVAMITPRPPATDAKDTRLQLWLGWKMAVSSPRHATIRAVYRVFSSNTKICHF